MSAPPLPPAQVPASVYDEAYYLGACLGCEEWGRSGGREAAGIYAGVLVRADLAPGEVVVDLGTGRGELPAVAVESGAARAYGVELLDVRRDGVRAPPLELERPEAVEGPDAERPAPAQVVGQDARRHTPQIDLPGGHAAGAEVDRVVRDRAVRGRVQTGADSTRVKA